MFGTQKTLEGGCGMGYVYSFQENGRYYNYARDRYETRGNSPMNVSVGGTGLFLACFVNTTECRKMYDELTSKYRLVMQTPRRRNENSGHSFITCMFDRRDSNRAKAEMPGFKPNWPFGKRGKVVMEPIVEDKTLD